MFMLAPLILKDFLFSQLYLFRKSSMDFILFPRFRRYHWVYRFIRKM